MSFRRNIGWTFLFTILFSVSAQAQFLGGGGFGSGTFSGIAGYVGIGVVEYSVLDPSARFRMNQGIYAYMGGEREIGKTGLFVTLSVNFMDSDGQSFYSYDGLGPGTHSSDPNDVDYTSSAWQLGLGIKWKFLPTGWFRPFVEGGGLFGYHAISYEDDGTITPSGGATAGDEKLEDGLVGYGYYAEVGVEVDFNDRWGIRLSGRYQISETRNFETLADSKVKFEARIAHIAVSRRF